MKTEGERREYRMYRISTICREWHWWSSLPLTLAGVADEDLVELACLLCALSASRGAWFLSGDSFDQQRMKLYEAARQKIIEKGL